MKTPWGRCRVAIFATLVVSLLAVGASVVAQTASRPRAEGSFFLSKRHAINLDHIDHVEFVQNATDKKMTARVFFAGGREAAYLVGEEAEQLRAALEDRSIGRPHEKGKVADGSGIVAFDDFDGALTLNWKPVRPDPSHVSLTRTPGALTITTQRGSIHGEETKDEFGEGIQAKNLYLIDNPLAKDADFVVTTCVSGFTPVMPYQQAGLIVYNDDDNYLKWGYEFNGAKGEGQAFCILEETDAKSNFQYVEGSENDLKRYWLRLTKQGARYEFASSTDGKEFRTHGEVTWGDGEPRRVGILAKNGGNKEATELDARFEFFELRPTEAPGKKK